MVESIKNYTSIFFSQLYSIWNDNTIEFNDKLIITIKEYYIIVWIFLFIICLIIAWRIHIYHRKKRDRRNRRKNNRSNTIYNDLNSPGYRREIINSLPSDSRTNFSNLYNQLDVLQNRINSIENILDEQQFKAIDSIDRKLQESKMKIENYWSYQEKRREFYHCIGLHYASFTLADRMKCEQEKIRDSFVLLKRECDKISKQIASLNSMIASAKGRDRYELMQKHQTACATHKRLSALKSTFGEKNTQYLKKVNAQNIQTAMYRDYIIRNFGDKGRNWGNRILSKRHN